MPHITVVNRHGEEIVIEARSGISVMENIRNAGVDEVLGLCGGLMSCATCHVIIDENWLDAVGGACGDEFEMLDSTAHKQPASRLSCQIVMRDVLNGLRVTLAPEE